MQSYTQHPLSAAFPSMGAEDFQALKDSISAIGVQNPITVFEGMVIDGWHRYTAANELGMDCPVAELGEVDPRDFVLAQNKSRRHITAGQLAMAANAVYAWRPAGRPKNNSAGPAELSQRDVSDKTGVSVRSLRQAKKVEQEAVPAVVKAVQSGRIGLEKATAIARLPKEKQAAEIDKPMPKKKAPPAAAPQPEPEPQPQPEPEPANDADTGQSLDELIQEIQRENEQLHAQLKAMEADDTKAELRKALLQRDHAVRQQSEAMDKAAASQRREKRSKHLLMRCGRAVGEEDPEKIPAMVEAMARQFKKAA